jgi:recombination protein RecT
MSEAITRTQTELKTMLAMPSIQDRIAAMLGDRKAQFSTSLLSLVSASAQLQRCDAKTIMAAAMTAATLDLPIQKDLGFANIVPYKTEAQFQMGYKGFIQLAMRTGQYRRMNAECLNAEALKGFDGFGEPVIDWGKFDPTREAVAYWFGFQMVNGFEKQACWSRERCEQHAGRYSKAYQYDRSQGKPNSPWSTNFDAMALKTVVKNTLSKWGYLSVELQTALVADQGVQAAIDVEPRYVDNDDKADSQAAAADLKSKFSTHETTNTETEVNTNA